MPKSKKEEEKAPLPAWAKEQLTSATDAQFDNWAERILDAQSLQEVLAQ